MHRGDVLKTPDVNIFLSACTHDIVTIEQQFTGRPTLISGVMIFVLYAITIYRNGLPAFNSSVDQLSASQGLDRLSLLESVLVCQS